METYNGYLDYPFKNQHFETDKDIFPLVLAPLNIQKKVQMTTCTGY
jgi:hypothetical protein